MDRIVFNLLITLGTDFTCNASYIIKTMRMIT